MLNALKIRIHKFINYRSIIISFYYQIFTPPSRLALPGSNTMFLVSLCIYYLSVSGLTYDILNSPPAFGVEMDDHGNGRPVAILQWQVISSSV